MSMSNLFIGLMSGTSVDAIDAVLVNLEQKPIKLLATHNESIPTALRQEILALCHPSPNAIHRLGETDTKLGHLLATAVKNLLKKTNYQPHQINAIGSHGQSIRHNPGGKYPFTIQIGDPNIIVALTNITTVADFRRRDMALGGQAAPLAPAFHEYILRNHLENCWVLNIGGIANLTLLAADKNQAVIGFDTGPGNTLLDAWSRQHINQPYDENGDWAASGKVNEELLHALLKDTYFSKQPPKSTGPEYFNLTWLQQYLNTFNTQYKAEDIQATLTELTAQSIARALNEYPYKEGSLWVCGGGTKNKLLMKKVAKVCHPFAIHSTESIGIHPDWIEACAFAWLAKQTVSRQPGNMPSVTGAKKASIIGCIYPNE